MIFVTVGTQLPFDRLVQAVDDWAGRHPDEEVFAQIGPARAWSPRHMQHARFLPPAQADGLMKRADVIVAHAGMGSVLNAMALQRPIVIVPRRAALGEHRNDHQVATARWLEERPGVFVAWEETAVAGLLDDRHRLSGGAPISPYASGPLVEMLAETVARSVQSR
jgi:UDP-N-acetylglucosamine transferase subunit ALG13